MSIQPKEDPPLIITNFEYDGLEESLKTAIYSQGDNNISLTNDEDSSSSSVDQLVQTDSNETSNETPDETLLREVFPDAVLPKSPLLNLTEDTTDDNDIVAPAADMESENGTANDGLSTTISVPDVIERVHLKFVDSAIQKKLLSVVVQPPLNPRRRYNSEGKRRVKRLQGKPMTLDLSKLKNYDLNPSESLWLRVNLTSVNKDVNHALDGVHIHPDELQYRVYSGHIHQDRSVRVPIKRSMIKKGKLELKELLITKKNYNTYDFQLVPYDIHGDTNASEPYTIDEEETAMANAKKFRTDYNLDKSQLVCQLLIKENQTWHFTDIVCLSKAMVEQKRDPQASKRKNKKKRGKNSRSKASRCVDK